MGAYHIQGGSSVFGDNERCKGSLNGLRCQVLYKVLVLGTQGRGASEGLLGRESVLVYVASVTSIDKATHSFHIQQGACEQCLTHTGFYCKCTHVLMMKDDPQLRSRHQSLLRGLSLV